MVETKAKVVALDGDHALVSIQGEGCGRCHEPGGCGGSSLTKMFCASPSSYRVLNSGKARVGDTVTVVMDSRALLRSAMVGYGIPLLGVFLGAFFGFLLAGEIGSMLGAAGGLMLSLGFHRLRLKRGSGSDPASVPRIK